MLKRNDAGTSWIQYLIPKPQARLRLFCFPYAGGSASLFRLFSQYLPAEIEVCPVQLPGRESRLRERAYTRLEPLVDALLEVLGPYLTMPFAFFGHSMGAMISFELARALRRFTRLPIPMHLFVSGHRAPQLPTKEPPISHLAEEQFIEKVRNLKGTPEEVLEHTELLQLLIPLLRADFELCETYQWKDEPPLDCPLSAYGGLSDEAVPRETILAWREQTKASFHARFFPGEHFYIHSQQQALLFALAQELTQDLQAL
jgi:medium-chain acyl-[acyl-carrier-protein] hydrolase